jgi:hypothetical protein
MNHTITTEQLQQWRDALDNAEMTSASLVDCPVIGL